MIGAFRQMYKRISNAINRRKQAEEATKAALKEKEVLLRELYHRTKNNMQVISSMLALQSTHVKDKASQSVFREVQNRVQSDLSMIITMIRQQSAATSVPERRT